MKGGKYSTTDKYFSGSSPSNSGGEEGNPESTNKQTSIERAKQLALDRAKSNGPQNKETRESLNESVQAETRPGVKLPEWNPNSKWAGPMRIVQHIPPARKLAERFVASGNRYSENEELIEDNYSQMKSLVKMDEFPDIQKSGDYIQKLERDKLLIDGYGKELSLVDRVEANESPKDKKYYKAKKLVDTHLSKQRDAKVNLKGSREFLLKKLSNPKDERMYSSLNLLYFYCDRNW